MATLGSGKKELGCEESKPRAFFLSGYLAEYDFNPRASALF